jgi:hypothetical protein
MEKTMKVNYDFYTGKDTYSDGDVEKDIIKYLEDYGEENYTEIFKKDIRWPVFYHITPIRKNILKWYEFKENAEVLEIGAGMGAITGILCDKAAHVTSVELSKQRAMAIEKRCKDKENLELIIGNFNDIKFEKKFDYITLIGVLEYAPLYTNSNNPFEDFLKTIKSLLKDDGKLLIAIENQFGMKYFSGVEEDHTNKIYDGITGYENKKGIRTFGKNELKEILQKSGYTYTKFYYPMPDYKLPNIIFSDEYLPNEENIKNYNPYLSNEGSETQYDEKEAYKDIIKNKQFDFFANSFFIEASQKEINTKVDLNKQDLFKVDDVMQKFYDNHYKIKEKKDLEKQLIEENKKLRDELNAMVNSKSWKITKPIRDFRTKNKSK